MANNVTTFNHIHKKWLKDKYELRLNLAEDERINNLAKTGVGLKPQGVATNTVGRIYAKYVYLFNSMCECYDQITQVQIRPDIKKIIDALSCRILEIKKALEKVENFEFTYTDNALIQLKFIPTDAEIICPTFYPLELRDEEKQYIMDEIMAGNRIGDPKPTESELLRQKEAEEEEAMRLEEEKLRKLSTTSAEIEEPSEEILSPEELEELRIWTEYHMHLNTIKRMDRARSVILDINLNYNKDVDTVLELKKNKVPLPRKGIVVRAAIILQRFLRAFMKSKRQLRRDNKRKHVMGMLIYSWNAPNARDKWLSIQDQRRNMRKIYQKQWLNAIEKENARVVKLKEGHYMEDITKEIWEWLLEWYYERRIFDDFPLAAEGGSILLVKGEMFTIEEYDEWVDKEKKRRQLLKGKTKEDLKNEKLREKAELKRKQQDEIERQRGKYEAYKKARMNPKSDPGALVPASINITPLQEAFQNYKEQWEPDDALSDETGMLRGFLKDVVSLNAYKEVNLKCRMVVDEIMRFEIAILKKALLKDREKQGLKPLVPITKTRIKPKVKRVPPPPVLTMSPAAMFQLLVDNEIIKKYPRTTFDEVWGDRNYAAAEARAIPWVPTFPPQCLGDVIEQVKVKCLLTLGCDCPDAQRTQLLVGPPGVGKLTMVYAIATETNSILIDMSPRNIYNKFPGKKFKKLISYVNIISAMFQPCIILVKDVDKVFCKKVLPEDRKFKPKRLLPYLAKKIIKAIDPTTKVMVIGTASAPWLAKARPLAKCFPSIILFPRADYCTISFFLYKLLMTYHGIKRDYNVSSLAQCLRGFDIRSIKNAVQSVLSPERLATLYCDPLESSEIMEKILDMEHSGKTAFLDDQDYEQYNKWYLNISPWGKTRAFHMEMLRTQLNVKQKEDKKKKKNDDDDD